MLTNRMPVSRMYSSQALPVVVDADFDEGLPEEEHDKDAAPPPEADSASLDSGISTVTASSPQEPKLLDQRADASDKAAAASSKLCSVCGDKADAKWLICTCGARSHIECLAKRFLQVSTCMHANIGHATTPSMG